MKRMIKKYRFFLVALLVAMLFWLMEALLDTRIYDENFWESVFVIDIHELRMRAVPVFFIFLFGGIVQILVKRKDKIERRKNHLVRVLRAIRNVNQLITWQKEKNELIQSACNLLTENRGYRGALIVLFDEKMKADKVVESGWEDKNEEIINRLRSGSLIECCKRALENEGVILVKNTQQECKDCPLLNKEINSRALTTRLEQNGKIYGMMSVNVPGSFAEITEEQELVKEIAGDLAFALHDIELESKLKQSEKKYYTLFESAKDAVFLANRKTGIIEDVNKSAEVLTGYDKKQLIGKHQLDLHPQNQKEQAGNSFIDDFEKGIQTNIKYFDIEHADGRRIPVEINPRTIIIGGEEYVFGIFRDISYRIRAKEQLEESRKFLSVTLQSLPGMLMVIDQDYRVVSSNWKEHDLHPEEKLKQFPYCYKVFKHKELPCDYCPPMDAFTDGQPRTFVDQNPVDGSYKEIFVSPIFDENNKVTHVMEYVQDITERKKAEEQIEESEKKYRSLIEQSRDAIFILSPEGRHIEVNRQAEKLLKYTREELIGMSYREIVQDNYVEDSSVKIEELRKGNKFDTYEKVFVAKNGQEIPVEITASAVRNEKNEIKYILSIVRDISERKRAESSINKYVNELKIISDVATELNRSKTIKETLRVIGETAYRLNPHSRIILSYSDINDPDVVRIRDYYGFSRIVNKLIQLIGKDPRKMEFRVSEMSFENRKKYTADGFILLEDGVYQLFNGNIAHKTAKAVQKMLGVEKVYTMGFSHQDEPKGGIVILVSKGQQLNQQKLMENMVKHAAINLEHIFSDQALKIAKEKAEESDRLKSAFLANMSHEIRTPMNGIIGFSQVLLEKQFPAEKQKKFLEIIHSRSKNLLEIISDIIDISKIEAGQLNMIYDDFYLNDLISDLYNHYGFNLSNLAEKNIRLSYYMELPRELSFIHSDPTRLKQVMSNLINNAFKFTQRGSVEFGYEKIQDDLLRFYVKDTGIGIPEKQKEFVFDRFRQVDGSSTRNYEGTGLGLSIAKNIVEQWGGQIWVDSAEDKGSVFYFTLPYKTANQLEASDSSVPLSNQSWKDKTFLLVEDDPTSCSFFTEVFEPSKVNLLVAETGKKGLELFESHSSIDLILMDISLPDMDGIQVTKSIRKLNKEVPIIAQTAHALGDDKNRCIDAGCNDYITKPIDVKSLYSLIDNFFK